MKCTQDNWEDIKKYYLDTLVKITETGDKLWQVTEVTPEEIVLTDLEGEQEYYDLELGCELTYALPHKKVYQFGDRAFLLARKPARMWKKGLSEKNCLFYALGNKTWYPQECSFTSYQAFINKPAYPSGSDALLLLREQGCLSVALGERLSISSSRHLFVDTTVIGKLLVSKKTIVLTNRFFVEEVKNIFTKFEVVYVGT